METQEQLLECLLCGLEQSPDVAGLTSNEGFEAFCQGCGKKFCRTVRHNADLEWSAS
jgi:hypothetical protein